MNRIRSAIALAAGPVLVAGTVLVAGSVLMVGGCSGPAGGASGGAGSGGTATVLAAASLTESFGTLEAEFERRNPGHRLEISFGASSTLATQIQQGAPADLFASADQQNMDKAVAAGAVQGEPKTFAHNTMAIVVPAGNPRQITGLAGLTEPGLRIALAGPAVPIGRTAREAFTKAGLTVPAASQEPDVKAVLNRVALGEADAGIVWVTDVKAGKDKVTGVDIPAEHNTRSPYPIAVINSGAAKPTAERFMSFVLSPDGQRILTEYGFQPDS